MKYLFIDESKAKDFLLCVVEIDEKDVSNARAVVGNLRKKGQKTVHFVSESISRKREILSEYSKLNIRCTNFISSNKKEVQAREACLKEVIRSLAPNQRYTIVIDRDESNVRRDKLVFLLNLPKHPDIEVVRYEHEEPSQETLLWLPDAIAWTSAKGGKWKSLLNDVALRNYSVD